MNFFKAKNEKEKNNILLERLCASFEDKFLITDITLTVSGEGGDPDQYFAGKLILSKFPQNEKTTIPQNEGGLDDTSAVTISTGAIENK